MANDDRKKRPRILTGSPLDLSFMGGRMPTVDLEGEMITGRLRPDKPTPANINRLGSYKRGGKVKKTGLAKVHKGERVLTAKQAKAHAKPASRRAPKRRTRR